MNSVKNILMALAVGAVVALTVRAYDYVMEDPWMSADDIALKEDSAEMQDLKEVFDRDNGRVYCVPKMEGQELEIFRLQFPVKLMASSMISMMYWDRADIVDQDDPTGSMLRLMLISDYPCK